MGISALRNILLNADQSNWHNLIKDYLKSKDLFYGHGTLSANDEAFWIVNFLKREHADDKASALTQLFDILQERVGKRLPLAYVLGEAYFATLPFIITTDVIVPRSPIAELILDDFLPWITLNNSDRVLELCTGCGCIALAIAHFNPGTIVDATDISSAAIKLSRSNAKRLNLHKAVSFYEVDLFPETKHQYKLIVSNPPYVPSSHIQDLPAEFKHEPVIAFDGGQNGLVLVDRIIKESIKYLTDDGSLILEVGEIHEYFSSKYQALNPVWIALHNGGEGVCIISKTDLMNYFLNS